MKERESIREKKLKKNEGDKRESKGKNKVEKE